MFFINKCYIRICHDNLVVNNSNPDMPYRRLPNTDTARIKAMKTALEKGKELPPNKLAFSSKTIVRLQRFLPLFDHNFQLYRQVLSSQNKKSRDYNETLKKARIYLTHFIRGYEYGDIQR